MNSTETGNNHGNDNTSAKSAAAVDTSLSTENSTRNDNDVSPAFTAASYSTADDANIIIDQPNNSRVINIQLPDGKIRQIVLGENNQWYSDSADNSVEQMQFVLNESNELISTENVDGVHMLDGTNEQYVINQNKELIATEESFQTVETTMINNDEHSSSVLASILATVNVLADEVRKMRAELGETTKKVDEIYDVFIKGTNAEAVLNRRNEPKTMTQFVFTPIGTVADATIIEELLEQDDYKDKLVRMYI